MGSRPVADLVLGDSGRLVWRRSPSPQTQVSSVSAGRGAGGGLPLLTVFTALLQRTGCGGMTSSLSGPHRASLPHSPRACVSSAPLSRLCPDPQTRPFSCCGFTIVLVFLVFQTCYQHWSAFTLLKCVGLSFSLKSPPDTFSTVRNPLLRPKLSTHLLQGKNFSLIFSPDREQNANR